MGGQAPSQGHAEESPTIDQGQPIHNRQARFYLHRPSTIPFLHISTLRKGLLSVDF